MDNVASPTHLFDGFRPEALEELLRIVKENEMQENDVDLYCNCTNLHSVIEQGTEYEAD